MATALRDCLVGPEPDYAQFTSDLPRLLVTVDTEEEFDWYAPFDRKARSVRNVGAQHLAQTVFADYGLIPTYVLDQAILEDAEAVSYFKDLLIAEKCRIGSHLHPWLTQPYLEDVNNANSYPGNLPAELEYAKLAALTQDIAAAFGHAPRIYKAGRYGIGCHTEAALVRLGYTVDLSIVPHVDYSPKFGPDFTGFPVQPFWLGKRGQILALPMTCGFVGFLSSAGPRIYPHLSAPLACSLRIPGAFARSGCLERIVLTPEGVTAPELIKLVRRHFDQGHRIFHMAYHSSSLLPGGSPYVADGAALDVLLDTIRRFLDYFFETLCGQGTVPDALFQEAQAGR